MMFFTPELYARLNSSECEEFDRASNEWAAALGRYREQIESLASIMPNRTRQLATQCRFHDSEVVSMTLETSETTSHSRKTSESAEFFTFSLLSELWAHFIFYALRRPIVRKQHIYPDVFSGEKEFWLYDEVRLEPLTPAPEIAFQSDRSSFVHGVLLSSGLELEIPFADVFIQAIPLNGICSDSAPAEPAVLNCR